MGIDQFLDITYKCVSSDMNAYMEAMGVPELMRGKLAGTTRSVTLTKSGGVYTAKTRSSFRDHDIVFTPGEEYEDHGVDGKTRRCITTIDGSKMLTSVLSEPQSTIVSEFSADKLVVTMESGGVQGQEIFEKV